MPAPKRKSFASRARSAKRKGRLGYANIVRKRSRTTVNTLQRQITNISRAIETKESAHRITNVQLAHNNVTVFNNAGGGVFNIFEISQGTGDPMGVNGNRIGDKVQIKGMLFKFFVEGSLNRSKVYFRFMLIKMAKGDTLTRATLFKDVAGNKMIDQINTERFTVIAQKVINVLPPNEPPATLVALTGIPATNAVSGITGNKILSMYVPGKKFGRDGNVTYENGSNTQVKFYDYRLCCVAYDWYGTPQDTNNVGFINDGFVKVYFKDA
jgi:hypothetical protein